MKKIISVLFLTHHIQAYYTNKQASDCFQSATEEACRIPIKECVDTPSCLS